MANFYATYSQASAGGVPISGTVTALQGTTPWLVDTNRVVANAPLTKDYTSGGGVTTAAYVQLVAATSSALTRIYVQDTSGSFMILATGAPASEVPFLYYGPGFASFVDIAIPAGTRVSIKALDVSATTGRLVMGFFT